MTLQDEIDRGRSTVHTDGYAMSVGELLNMYRDKELDVHPDFQRVFRWGNDQKSRLIESILLGIPLPSIFVAQRRDGVWDVVDGLQRLSTIFQFVGVLLDESGQPVSPLCLEGTERLPSLHGKYWTAPGSVEQSSEPLNALTKDQQLLIKRSKIDVKIVLRESDEQSKLELFQRLNTGGSSLSDQEIRNCLLLMGNREFYQWLRQLGRDEKFWSTLALSERLIEEQYHLDLATRFVVFRREWDPKLSRPPGQNFDIGRYLNKRILEIAADPEFDYELEAASFKFVFDALSAALDDQAFKRFDVKRGRFYGGFLISAFEAIAVGIGQNFEAYSDRKLTLSPDRIRNLCMSLWTNDEFLNSIGSGVRASERLPIIVPLGRKLFSPDLS